MYRFGDGSELKDLVGLEVCQVCLGEFETILMFANDAHLKMDGVYAHNIPSQGKHLRQARSACGPNELYRLLGAAVVDVRVNSPEQAELTFSNGDQLFLVDDSDEYESFIFTLDNKIIVV